MESIKNTEKHFLDPLEKHFISCSCSGANHVLHYKFWNKDVHESQDGFDGPDLFLELVTSPQPNIFKRLLSAIRGNDCHYLGFEHVYDREGAVQQRDLLDRYIAAYDKANGSK